jgi:hypothetical protein
MREATVTLSDGRVLGYAEHGDPEGAPIIYNHPLPGARNFNLEDPALRAAAAWSFTLERPGIGLSTRGWSQPPDHGNGSRNAGCRTLLIPQLGSV